MAETPLIGRRDIEDIFGITNVKKWADIENEDNATQIAGRIDWAITKSTARIYNRLEDGPYKLPFTDEGSGINETIIELMARQAGVLLYEGRRIIDVDPEAKDPMSTHEQMINETVGAIMGGRMKLRGHSKASEQFPRAISGT